MRRRTLKFQCVNDIECQNFRYINYIECQNWKSRPWSGEVKSETMRTQRGKKSDRWCRHLSVVGTGGEESAPSKGGMTGKQGLDVASLRHGEVMYSLAIKKKGGGRPRINYPYFCLSSGYSAFSNLSIMKISHLCNKIIK